MSRPYLSLLGSLALLPLFTQAALGADQHAVNPRQETANARSTSEGAAAFNEGNYAQALSYYERAYQVALAAGQLAPPLRYNRAVCLFKLGRLPEAQRAFEELAHLSLTGAQHQWSELAHYNLALIALGQGDMPGAQGEFTLLAQSASNARLKQLAERQLAALAKREESRQSATPRQSAQAKTSALMFSLAATSDDNAGGFADELANQLSNARDTYVSALGYGHHYVRGAPGAGLKLYALAQGRSYQQLTSYNTRVLGAGLDGEHRLHDWQLTLGGRWLDTEIGGAHLFQQWTLQTKGMSPLGQGTLELGYQGSYFASAKQYAYLDGWQHQWRASWRYQQGSWSLAPSLGWETNSRADKTTDNQFFSYSPQITSLGLSARWNLSQRWQAYGQWELAQAHYDGTNRLTDLGNQSKAQQREYTRHNLLLGGRYQFSRHWQLKGEYSQIASDDVFQLYSYDKHLFSLKLDYGW